MKITRAEFEAIMDADVTINNISKSPILIGLNIVEKYIPGSEICAEHDIIYSADIDDILDDGLTKDDAIELRKQNWMIDEDCDCLAHFT